MQADDWLHVQEALIGHSQDDGRTKESAPYLANPDPGDRRLLWSAAMMELVTAETAGSVGQAAHLASSLLQGHLKQTVAEGGTWVCLSREPEGNPKMLSSTREYGSTLTGTTG